MRLDTLLAGHAMRRPDHTALVFGATRLSYAQLNDGVRRVAAGLHRLGVRAGDRVLLFLPNGVEFVQAEYAVFALGAIAVPVNVRLTSGEVEHMFSDSQPCVAIYHAGGRAAVAAGLAHVPQCRRVVVGPVFEGETDYSGLLDGPDVVLPEVPPEPDDCMIMYTSGTTGKPKGAIITHANMIVQNVFMHSLEWDIGADDRYLAINPLAHRAGCARLFNALGLGGTLVVMERFDAEKALELIQRERITVTGLVPTVIRMLLPFVRKDTSRCASLRKIIVSTEAFPVELKREVLELLPQAEIHSLFGSTEALVTNLGHAEQFSHPASVGRPLPGVEVRIVDDAGDDVPLGEVGELLVRSGTPGRWATIRGYYRRPEATAEAIRNGWVHTGDMARMDADAYLYIVDRKKDMVLSGGYNIYSKEVEQALGAHPDISEAAVIGVPDPVYGESVAAFVILREGAVVDAEQVIEHCRERLAGYKKPKHVFFVESLPRNTLGKVLKNDLRAMAGKKLDA